MSHRVNELVNRTCQGASVNPYWITGHDRRPPNDTGKPDPVNKWGSLGLVPKSTWKSLLDTTDATTAKQIVKSVNEEVIATLYALDLKRTTRIKKLIKALGENSHWDPH